MVARTNNHNQFSKGSIKNRKSETNSFCSYVASHDINVKKEALLALFIKYIHIKQPKGL